MPIALRNARLVGVVAAFAVATLALTGCQPEPAPSASTTSTATASAEPTPTATPSPTPTIGPDDIALPTDCESIYSPPMLATLQVGIPPLNDPGVTMTSSQIVEALELLDAGVPNLRCTWGVPSEEGVATTVSIIEQDQSQELIGALQAVGFLCDALEGGTLCALERTTIDFDDNQVSLGESHFFRGNGWVSTAWIGWLVDGYTQDVAATLWS